jgi:hypothetical protein
VDQIDEGGFIREGRRNFMTTSSFEDEARLGAIDSNLFHIWICQVLSQRAERRHRRKDAAQQLLGLVVAHRRHCTSFLFADNTSDKVANPELIVDAHAREIAPCQLGCQLGLDARSGQQLDGRAVAGSYRHLETAEFKSG